MSVFSQLIYAVILTGLDAPENEYMLGGQMKYKIKDIKMSKASLSVRITPEQRIMLVVQKCFADCGKK